MMTNWTKADHLLFLMTLPLGTIAFIFAFFASWGWYIQAVGFLIMFWVCWLGALAYDVHEHLKGAAPSKETAPSAAPPRTTKGGDKP